MRKLLNAKNYRKADNRGLSLVELVVVMAILVMIGGAIYGFVFAGTQSYKNVSNDVDLQEEAQIAMNQLETLLMNAESGVNYMYFGNTITENPEDSVAVSDHLFTDSEIDASIAVTKKEIYIYNEKSRYVITWDEEHKTLNYKEEPRKTDAVTGAYTTDFDDSGEAALLAEYIEGFSATLDTSGKNIVVNVAMQLVKGDRKYQANQNITLRNSILLNEDESVIYDGAVSDGVETTYTGIKIHLGEQDFTTGSSAAYSVFLLNDGGDVNIPLSVTVMGTGFPSQEYTAELSGGTTTDGVDAKSYISGGRVVISDEESASSVTLTVASKMNPSVTCSVEINVKQITGVEIVLGNGKTTKSLRAGAELILNTDFVANVSANGALSDDEKNCTWEAVKNCTISGNTLKLSTASDATSFEVKATSIKDPSYSATYSGTIILRDASLNLSGAESANRGASDYVVTAKANDGTIYGSGDVEWSVSVNNGGKGVSVSDTGKLTVSGNNADLDYNTEYTITVTATLKFATEVSKSIDITIPKVRVQYASSLNGVYTGSFIVPMVNSKKSSKPFVVYYKIDGIENVVSREFEWIQWDWIQRDWANVTGQFSGTVTISDNTIAFEKNEKCYDQIYYWLEGTPFINSVQIDGSSLTVNNYASNVTLSDGSKYYIPVNETDGFISLAGTKYSYKVTQETDNNPWNPSQYYQLVVKNNDNNDMSYYKCSIGSDTWY